jgi:putative oxidoreductase
MPVRFEVLVRARLSEGGVAAEGNAGRRCLAATGGNGRDRTRSRRRHRFTLGSEVLAAMFHLTAFSDYGLLFLRIMAGAIFAASGYNDARDPDARSKSIGMPKSFTIFLAVAELAAGAGLILGVLQQLAAIGSILIMLGAVSKKVFVWKTGFWGKDGLGWSYELTLISMLLVILFTDGGKFVLLP